MWGGAPWRPEGPDPERSRGQPRGRRWSVPEDGLVRGVAVEFRAAAEMKEAPPAGADAGAGGVRAW